MPPPAPETTAPREVLTPSRLNSLARELIEGHFPLLWVEGELSNLSRPASGHLYFSLKDAQAQVRCAMFRPRSTWLRFKPADGQRVLARARVSFYEARGEFQLVVEQLEPAGEGELQREFERLKAKLAAEGLFEAARKRALPALPRRIGVLTSPSGAAVRDVVSVIGRRLPMAQVEILPVPVQGADAAERIRAMLQRAGASGRYDVLLLTRGGGSLEDLWSFNDEALARAIAACPVPVVAAIGHEIDFTLADFVADLRAPTPSAAAELLVPSAAELARALVHRLDRARHALQRRLANAAQRSDQAGLRLRAQRPATRLALIAARLAAMPGRLAAAARQTLDRPRQVLGLQALRLAANHPRLRLAPAQERLARLRVALARNLREAQAARLRRLDGLGRALHAVGPLATLERGYAILRDPADGRVVRSISGVAPDGTLQALLADGEADLRVLALRPRAPPGRG